MKTGQTLLLSRRSVWTVIALLAVLAAIPISVRLERGVVPFDSAAWRAAGNAGEGRDNPRYRMTKDLIEQLERRRPNKAEAIELLGPSQGGDYPYAVQYWVGAATLGIAPCQLRLHFGKDGRFEWARVVDDY